MARQDDAVEKDWYKALYEEDCLRLMELLDGRESLWSKGWLSDGNRWVTGRPRNYWCPERTSVWKGRTALHVGARRGCVTLIDRVVDLCKREIRTRDLGSRSQSRRDDRNSRSLSGRNRHANGNAQSFERASRHLLPSASPLSREETIDRTIVETDQPISIDIDPPEKHEEPEIQANHGDTEEDPRASPSLPVLTDSDEEYSSRYTSFREDSELSDDEVESSRHSASEEDFDYSDDGELISKDPMSLEKFLLEKDGEYKLDAFAIALVNGNPDVVVALLDAADGCSTVCDRYLIKKIPFDHALVSSPQAEDDGNSHRLRLREITEAVIGTVRRKENPRLETVLLRRYARHRDFNYLPIEEYFFHFLFTRCRDKERRYLAESDNMRFSLSAIDEVYGRLQTEMVRKAKQPAFTTDFRCFLWELQDGQGRRPLHVSVDEESLSRASRLLVKSMNSDETLVKRIINCRDGAGRTALQRSAALGTIPEFRNITLLQMESMTTPQRSVWWWELEWRPSALHKIDVGVVSTFNDLIRDLHTRKESGLRRTRMRAAVDSEDSALPKVCLDCVGLAALVGDVPVLSAVLEMQRSLGSSLYGRSTRKVRQHPEVLPALHIAAASGRYELLKMFIDDPLFDPFLVDSSGNTALHCAAKGLPLRFGHHLIDFVNCNQILKTAKERLKDSEDRHARHRLDDDRFLVEREGCIIRFLQFGCDIWEMNVDGEAPYPASDMSYKFLSWWYIKQAKEFGTIQRYLSLAANAVSVTGALVATTSFVGPLQPPGGNNVVSKLQAGDKWMKTFVICDTMSFYLAIVAIIFSLIPNLPMPQQSMTDELRRTRRMVTLAVVTLFPSIIFILVAFGAASMEATESDRISMGTLVAGGFMGIVAVLLFSVRVLAFGFPRSKGIKKLYDRTAF